MTAETESHRTRRAVLAAGLAAGTATVASALVRPSPVHAASGLFDSADASIPAVRASHSASGTGAIAVLGEATAPTGGTVGVRGQNASRSGIGVFGLATATTGQTVGVRGQTASSAGVGVLGHATQGTGGAIGVWGQTDGFLGAGVYGEAMAVEGFTTGAWGLTRSPRGSGVTGHANSGVAVRAETETGTAIHATALNAGHALRTSGRVRLEKASGVATIAAGRTSAVVSPGLDVTTSSFVLLTPRGNLGGRDLWYTTNPTANTITIRVSRAVSGALGVSWLLLG